MKLYLARHTETSYNVQHLSNADPNVPVRLTETGILQADELAENLKDIPFQAIYTSTLMRAHQTADRINKKHGVQLISDVRINDNKTGFEGKPYEEWQAAVQASPDPWHARFNGGESLEDVMARCKEFLEDLRSTGYDTVLVVTHGIIVQMLHGLINNLSHDELRKVEVPQGSYTIEEI